MAEVTFLEALRQGLWEEMERDERVFILGEDVGAYGGAFKVTEGFVERFGERRVIDTPISEAAIVGAAAGAAHMGMRPVAEMQFIDFISCAYDMLTNYVATARYRAGLSTPMDVRGPCGGYVRGGPFHSQNPEAAFFHTPGLKIVYPATARDAKGLIKASIRDDDPVIYLEHKWLYRRIKRRCRKRRRSSLPSARRGWLARGRTCPSSPTGPRCGSRSRRPTSCRRTTVSRSKSSTSGPCCRWMTPRSCGRCRRPTRCSSCTRTREIGRASCRERV